MEPTLRLRQADRQVLFRGIPLDQTVAPDHRVRSFVRLVEQLDLTAFTDSVRSVEGGAGRPAADPRVLVALWFYGLDQGITSARELDQLAKEHDVFRWVLGGVSTNYHQLSDFRFQHPAALQDAFEQLLVLMKKDGFLRTNRQALDGTKDRASAGAASFRREPKLRRLLQDPPRRKRGRTARQKSAQRRAHRERAERLKQAIGAIPEARRAKKAAERDEARVSTTDPEARVMKMADGGFRPAYNVQASSTPERIIVGLRVTDRGSDMGQLEPMLKQLEAHDRLPQEMLVDGGYVKLSDIAKAERRGMRVYAPEQEQRKAKANQPKPTDAPEVKRWRKRMGTASAQAVFAHRGEMAECVNADLKSHGLKVTSRGLEKELQSATWAAAAHNLRCWLSMKRQRL